MNGDAKENVQAQTRIASRKTPLHLAEGRYVHFDIDGGATGLIRFSDVGPRGPEGVDDDRHNQGQPVA